MTAYAAAQDRTGQRGASLLEVLVAVLILSFGLLALGGLVGQSVHALKVSGSRAIASMIADDLVERIRANAAAFDSGHYDTPLTFDGSFAVRTVDPCSYPDCVLERLAAWDLASVQRRARQMLPAAGFLVQNRGNREGTIYVLWLEARFAGQLGLTTSDICPPDLPAGERPRCVMVPFKL